MAKNKYALPFKNFFNIEEDGPITQERLIEEIEEKIDEGVSFVIKPEGVQDFHGGYLFNFKRIDDFTFEIYSISKRHVASIEGWDNLVSFVNHTTGRKYNEQTWNLSQGMNFKLFNEEIQPH